MIVSELLIAWEIKTALSSGRLLSDTFTSSAKWMKYILYFDSMYV